MMSANEWVFRVSFHFLQNKKDARAESKLASGIF
jgi:hypothetical protein